MKKRVIIPEELHFASASCGFECNNYDEVLAFAKYFLSIGCSFEVSDLYIEPKGNLIPLKQSNEEREVWEYLMLEF